MSQSEHPHFDPEIERAEDEGMVARPHTEPRPKVVKEALHIPIEDPNGHGYELMKAEGEGMIHREDSRYL